MCIFSLLGLKRIRVRNIISEGFQGHPQAKKANPKHGAMAGVVPLDLCLRHRNNDAVRILLGAKARADGGWGLTSACVGDNSEGVRLLCLAGCSPLATDPLGTPTVTAFSFGNSFWFLVYINPKRVFYI